MADKMRYGILISGGGTTMEQIIFATKDGRLPNVEVALVIASRPDAGGIVKAIGVGMEGKIAILSPRSYDGKEAFGEAILKEFRNRSVDAFGQHGWLPKTPENVIEAYWHLGLNQHPGMLDPGRPDFGGEGMFGTRVHAATMLFARMANRRSFNFTEATAQFVASEFDRGAVVGRVAVPFSKDDNVIDLKDRVLPAEHQLQIDTIRKLAEGTLTELLRPEPLIRPEEYHLLFEAKRLAGMLFPHG